MIMVELGIDEFISAGEKSSAACGGAGPLFPGRSVDPLAEKVCVTGVSGVLPDHVDRDPA